MSHDTPNGAGRVIIPPPAPTEEKPPQAATRPYWLHPEKSPEEIANLQAAGMDPANYVVVMCPCARPPILPQPLQRAVAHHPQTGEIIGEGLIFLLPVVIPVDVPVVAGGMLGPDGQPIGALQMETPPGALSRVLVPRKHLTPDAKAEDVAIQTEWAKQRLPARVAASPVETPEG